MSNILYNLMIAIATLISSPFSNGNSQTDFNSVKGELTSYQNENYQLATNRSEVYNGLDINPIVKVESNLSELNIDEDLLDFQYVEENPIMEADLNFKVPISVPDYLIIDPIFEEEMIVEEAAENISPTSVYVPDYLLSIDIYETEEQLEDSVIVLDDIYVPDYLLEFEILEDTIF